MVLAKARTTKPRGMRGLGDFSKCGWRLGLGLGGLGNQMDEIGLEKSAGARS